MRKYYCYSIGDSKYIGLKNNHTDIRNEYAQISSYNSTNYLSLSFRKLIKQELLLEAFAKVQYSGATCQITNKK